jgi:hypothetical protein
VRTAFGTGVRLAIILVVIAAIIVGPLFLVYQSRCVEDGKRVDSWSLVAPWDDPPSDCRRHRTGFEVLKKEVGL